MNPINPFLLAGYVSPEFFCNRVEETAAMMAALRNGRSLTLISPRRMGKTGLIRHVFYQTTLSKAAKCYYIDLYQTDSLVLLVQKLGDAVLGSLDTTANSIVRRVSSFFKSLRPVITIDPVTGHPSFSINIQEDTAERSLAEILDYMQQSGKPCYVAFDEFQAVAGYADRNVEALLRAHIQHVTNVRFIFSGSQRHVLESMFTSASRPFYQSTQMMHLDAIAESAYYDFAKEKLESHGQHLPAAAFSYLYGQLSGHTWYVQTVLNRLYESSEPIISEQTVDRLLGNIVDENDATYHVFLNLLTSAQGRLLKAIAKEGTVTELLGHAFISAHNLGATSTVKSAAVALVEKEMLLQHSDAYQVYDRFFSLWLKREP